MPLLANAAGWSAIREITESCVTPSCKVLSGSAFVFMHIACYRWNLLHKYTIYLRGFVPRSQRASSDKWFETLREREVRMGLRMPAVATMPQFPSPETTTTIWLPFSARMHTHTHGRHNCQVPRQPAHHPVPRMLLLLMNYRSTNVHFYNRHYTSYYSVFTPDNMQSLF